MTQAAQLWALRARLVFPVSAPPQRDSVVTIADDRILAVGQNLSGAPACDLGDVALLPGLVNPHTHLEFSGLARPLGYRGMPLPAWIKAVVSHRRAVESETPETTWSERRTALATGLQECLASGVTTVGDVVAFDLADLSWYQLPVRWYAFRELLGQTPAAIARQVDNAHQHLQRVAAATGVRAALSPHAPYSTARTLLTTACHLSRTHSLPVALHLAESLEELQLLATGRGPLRDTLEHLDAWYPSAFSPGGSPRDYLALLGTAHRGLVIHGNYLAAPDWEFLAQRADRMAVVYCPRTHQYFEHEPYPLHEMAHRGVRVVVATDSRASNPDLSIWEELQAVARAHPQVALDRILSMGTLDAAAALGCDHEVGSLEPGKRADLALVHIRHQLPTDPHVALFAGDSEVRATVCGGRFADQRRQQ